MDTVIFVALGGTFVVVASGVLSVPGVWLGVRAVRKDPAKALAWAFGTGAWCGVTLGLAGFVFGAGIGDESAGAIAVSLLAGGAVGGLLAGAAVSYAAIRLLTRGAPAAPPG